MKCPLCGSHVTYQGAVSIECSNTAANCQNGSGEAWPTFGIGELWRHVPSDVIFIISDRVFTDCSPELPTAYVLRSFTGVQFTTDARCLRQPALWVKF